MGETCTFTESTEQTPAFIQVRCWLNFIKFKNKKYIYIKARYSLVLFLPPASSALQSPLMNVVSP